MTEIGALFTLDLASLILITLILVIISIALSLISLVLVRSSAKKAARPPPREATKPAAPTPPRTVKPPTTPTKETRRIAKPPSPPRKRGEGERALIGEELGVDSLEDLASMVGVRSIILFNETGIPIESYNVSDEEKVAASAADFISLMRKLNPGFSSMTSEDGRRVMLFSVKKIGEVEVFALAVSEAEAELGAEEIKDFLRAYLSESLGRYR